MANMYGKIYSDGKPPVGKIARGSLVVEANTWIDGIRVEAVLKDKTHTTYRIFATTGSSDAHQEVLIKELDSNDISQLFGQEKPIDPNTL